MTKTELMGPTGFWLETLLKDDHPKREYLPLPDVAARLGCESEYLLDEGIARKLDLYAPVLREGLYAWPVSDRGIPHESQVGSIDAVEPVFCARLQYGEYAALPSTDIEKIKIEQSVTPVGYICPELVMRRVVDWQEEQPQAEQAAMFAERMKRRAKEVAWVLAQPSAASSHGVVRLEMLRVAGGEVERLSEQLNLCGKAHNARGFDESQVRLHPTDQGDGYISTISKNKIMEYPFRGEVSSAIVRAIDAAPEPENFHSVWEELIKLAERKLDPLLGVNADGKIRFRNSKGTTNTYEKSSLAKSLGRAVKAAKSSHKTP
ncbi:hypothetical protein [Pandoraea anhela]|uniref:Uncharacterized protein n=1 Tax=Pandoraea anhela TaxID=2508295 RepID=A0A5E4UQ77_9BURK|nr:hypothetical protein [Pandoraea anhela]VVE02142.1 hypothetical protein PAN31108_02187 [Pandoraea anhela]